jgi:hypothetical protein
MGYYIPCQTDKMPHRHPTSEGRSGQQQKCGKNAPKTLDFFGRTHFVLYSYHDS